jgi:replicative DNA helicase
MSLESERAIIAAVSTAACIDPSEGLKVLEASRVRAEDFTLPEHADLWRVALDFLGRGVPLELFAVKGALKSSVAVARAGGADFLTPLLMDFQHDGRAASEHAKVVRDASLRRRALASLRAVALQLKDAKTPVSEVLSVGSEAWAALTTGEATLGTAEGDLFTFGALLTDAQEGRRELCLPTGIQAIDEAIGGLQPAVLTMLGALPGVGKSAVLATIARNLALSGRRVGFFSLEDDRLWLTRRFLSLESRVPLFLLATKPLTPAQKMRIDAAGEPVHRTLSNLVIDDRLGLTPSDVAQSARDMILSHGCKAIMVDHLGEMRLSRSERYDLDIAEALSQLRDIAKRHHVPVLVASHVRRRQGLDVFAEPSLTDFANSSAPERMARVALGLSLVEGGIRVSVLKQTNGPSGVSFGLRSEKESAMVSNFETVAVPE